MCWVLLQWQFPRKHNSECHRVFLRGEKANLINRVPDILTGSSENEPSIAQGRSSLSSPQPPPHGLIAKHILQILMNPFQFYFGVHKAEFSMLVMKYWQSLLSSQWIPNLSFFYWTWFSNTGKIIESCNFVLKNAFIHNGETVEIYTWQALVKLLPFT